MFFRLHQLHIVLITFAIALGGVCVPYVAYAATITLTPASGQYESGQTFTAQFRVNPEGDDVNAVEANLSFDSDVLEVVSLSKDGSAFSLWTTEPEFSNVDGTVTFGGGSPTPFSSPSTVLNATFRAAGEGSGSVNFDDVSILIADGQGTDAFSGATDASYTVAASTPEPTPEPEPTPQPDPASEQEPATESESEDDALTFGDPPRAPEVGSKTFLDADEWYSVTEGVFTWSLPFDASVVAVNIATTSDAVPYENDANIFDPPIEEFQITEEMVEDGVQYLSIAYENQVGWGTVLNRKLQIDTSPPEPFEVEVRPANEASEFPTLHFDANDKTSGVAYYELFLNDREPVRITPDEAELGYLLGELKDGTYTARVVAHDKAGNTREATAPVLITAGWQPPQENVEEQSIWDFFTLSNIIILVLLLIIILQGIYFWYQQKWAKQREEKLRRETREIQEQMEKIFSALRDEIYDQINTITKRKRLSKKEREAVEGLNQALEVSETLIEKEVNDVNSILR
jgi:hypothetical protein